MQSVSSSRRKFLQVSGLASAASLLSGCQANQSAEAPSSGRAKNLIFLMVDGLCNGTLGLAHHWKLRNVGERLHWMQLYDRPDFHRCFQDTASASSPVTDSAAAASSWGSGQRVMNGSVNVDASGKQLKPILSYAKEAGKKTGLVTTCRITHATPAGFATNVHDRYMEDEIARQYMEREIDVLLGGGSRHFVQTQKDGSHLDYLSIFQSRGYDIALNRSELSLHPSNRRLLGLFSKSHVPYAIDRKNDPALSEVPSLTEMFEAALARLSGTENGFVLQVEGGRVDHAGHANDPGAILHEFLEYDACIPIALEYIRKHPDTMLIVTTDHGTGGCQLDGQGDRYNDSGPALDRINQLNFSFEWLQKRFEARGQFDAATLEEALHIEATTEQGTLVQKALDEEAKYLSGALSAAFGRQLKQMTSVGWSSSKHTSECVDLFAFGPHATNVPAFINNYEIFGIMMEALGLNV